LKTRADEAIRDALRWLLNRRFLSRSELTGLDWWRAGDAVRSGAISW
jgi:hypothetical protein